jgi:hypothetical protein
MGIFFLAGIHSWDFNISDEATVSICERHMVRLVAAECIELSNRQIRDGNYIPTAMNDPISGV